MLAYFYSKVLGERGARGGATSRKVAGWIPSGITGIFHWHNPSRRTIQLLTEMSTRNICWDVKAAGA